MGEFDDSDLHVYRWPVGTPFKLSYNLYSPNSRGTPLCMKSVLVTWH